MTNPADIKDLKESDDQLGRVRRPKRESGSGCLIPPRIGVSQFWRAQVRDRNGKTIRRSRLNSGAKVRGELKPNCDPSKTESWTNISQARILLKELIENVERGDVAVGHDPSQIYYSDLRQLLLQKYTEGKHKSLRKNKDGEDYLASLPSLDSFMGYMKEGDRGMKVSNITSGTRDSFVEKRKEEGAANGTINRSLAALRRMFILATQKEMLRHVPIIQKLPEPKQPRQGFLSLEEYERLYNALGQTVTNAAKKSSSQPYAYVQPLLQVGFYTGMRREEIVGLRWGNVDLAAGFIRLFAGETKNDDPRDIPMIDGLPALFESLKRKNPLSGENDLVFLNDEGARIVSFGKAWKKACIKAAISTKFYNVSTVSHFSNGPECCAACRQISKEVERPIEKGKYMGFLFHDLRRSFISNMTQAGVDNIDAMHISGHKTSSVFQRYNIKTDDRAKAAGEKVAAFLQQKREANKEAKPETKLQIVAS